MDKPKVSHATCLTHSSGKNKVKRGYTVVTYAKDKQERKNNIIFVELLRGMLDIRKQMGKEEKIKQRDFDKKMSRWIKASEATILIFTPSFASNTWSEIFNKRRFTYYERTRAKKMIIPVIMPPYQRTALQSKLGEIQVLAHDPVVFGSGWESDLNAWVELAKIVQGTGCSDRSRVRINLVEFSVCMKYAIRNRQHPGEAILKCSLLGTIYPRLL